MKITAFLILAAALQVSARGTAQITLSEKKAPLEKVLKKIKQQSGYTLFYDQELVRRQGLPVDLQLANVPLPQALNAVFQHQLLTYEITGTMILVKEREAPKAPAPIPPAGDTSRPRTPVDIHGQVTDPHGEPFLNANITVRRTGRGTVTDANGNFTLLNVDPGDLILVSFIGYKTQMLSLKDRSNWSIVLEASTDDLDMAVVQAYGTTSQRYATGSIGVVRSSEIAGQPVTNSLMALEGRVAGVQMTVSSGEPGASIAVRIRGQNTSFSATAYPLFIVDGVAFPYGTNLNSINPGDIESVSILKDADATAVYGSRGANGVILITTKKGKAGMNVLNVDLSTGFSQAARLLKSYLHTPQYLAMRQQAYLNDGLTPDATNAPDLTVWSQTAYTDWQKEIIGNTGHYTNLQASVSGGDERVRYLLSGSYNYNEGIVWGSSFDKRANVHANIENNSRDKRFQMSTNLTYSNDNIRTIGNDATISGLSTAPNMPKYDSTGAIYYLPNNHQYDNPLFSKNRYGTTNTDNILGNTKLSYSILPNLKPSVSVGYTKLSQDGYAAQPSNSLNPVINAPTTNMATFSTNYVSTFVTEPQLDYSTHIGKGKLQAMAGGTWQETKSGSTFITGVNFSSDALLRNLAAAGSIVTKRSNESLYKYESVFLRGNYNWMDRYLVNGNFRRDGSSRFGDGYKFGNFWSAGAAWIFSNETFFKKAGSLFTFGKLRGSYGVTGNDQIGDYQYLDFYYPTDLPYNGASGIISTQVTNNQYRWEETSKRDIGLELGAFNSRVLLTIDYFNNKSRNLLTYIPLGAQAGYAGYVGNSPAEVQNKGWEFTLNTVNIKGRSFSWSSSFNLTLPKNTLLAYPDLASSVFADRYEVGKSINIIREYRFAGISPANGAPLFYTAKGTVTDGTPTGGGALNYPDDLQYIGNTDPSLFGGLGNSFGYRGFELNVFFQFSRSRTNNSFLSQQGQPLGSMYNTGDALLNGIWAKPGQVAERPALTTNSQTAVGQQYAVYVFNSSANYVSNAYVRLKTLALTWSMPSGWSNRLKLTHVQIYAQAQNLLTFTHYSYLDPESQSAIPILRTITFGLRASL